MSELKRVILFNQGLVGVGGAERLMFEEAKYCETIGIKTFILTYDFDEKVLFNQTFNPNLYVFNMKYNSYNYIVKAIYRIFSLRKKIKVINPSIIIASNAWDCMYLYFATLFTQFSYVTHIHGTIFWFNDDLLKYTFIFKKVFNKIRESVIGHKEFILSKPPKVNLLQKILSEFAALAMYIGVRKAKKIFVLSNQMKWEVNELFGKNAIVIKGAFPREIFSYKQKRDIKELLNIADKRMILNVNRLDPRKRIDLLINSFKIICDRVKDPVLIIGGVGPEEKNLKALVKKLNLQDRVKFVGYIKEEELWDYLLACDVFVHPNWADFAIAAYEPLALQKKVVWSTEMEIDEHLTGNKYIFAANPTVNDFAQSIEKALATEVCEKKDLSVYTWDEYCKKIIENIQNI